MSKRYDDLLELLHEHKKSISHSFLFYRAKAKIQKMIVLDAAMHYLAGEISKKDLNDVINKNPQYADAIGKSKTKKLIESVLKNTPCFKRTREGYFRVS